MVVLGAVEGFERDDLRDDAVLPGVGGIELRDVGLGDALLIIVGVEDGGTVGGAGVRALAVERGGVVDGEEDAEELAVGEARGIVDDFDGFCVVGGFGGDVVVVGGAGGAAGVAGGGGEDALDALEDGLRAQKQPPAKTAVARPGDVASGRSVVGGGMGPCSSDSEWQATVTSERVSARAALVTERRRIRSVSHFAIRGVRRRGSGRVFAMDMRMSRRLFGLVAMGLVMGAAGVAVAQDSPLDTSKTVEIKVDLAKEDRAV